MNIITVLLFIIFFFFTKKGVKGAESLARWIAPLYLNTSFSLLVTLMTLLPGSIEGLMGLWEEQAVFPFKGLELCDEGSLFMWGAV